MFRVLTLVLLLGVISLACGLSQEDVDRQIADALEAAATVTPQPTATLQPTPTPRAHDVPEDTPTPNPTLTATPSPTLTLAPTSAPTATPNTSQYQEAINLAEGSIRQYPEVREALISPTESGSFHMGISVTWDTDYDRALDLGEAFLRMFKTFNADVNPGRTLGTGIYDYVVLVVYPDMTHIAMGVKISAMEELDWSAGIQE